MTVHVELVARIGEAAAEDRHPTFDDQEGKTTYRVEHGALIVRQKGAAAAQVSVIAAFGPTAWLSARGDYAP